MTLTRILLAVLMTSNVVLSQQPTDVLEVGGDVRTALRLTAEDLAQMPRASVHTTSNRLETTYEGVWLHEVLKRAGIPQGESLRGPALASYVLAVTDDGYQVVFSLGELDPSFIDNQILLADTANGMPLFGAQGRFRLVVPRDTPGARSVRMLTRLEVVQLRK